MRRTGGKSPTWPAARRNSSWLLAQLTHPTIPWLCAHLLSVCHYHRYALWKCIQTPFKTDQLPGGRLLIHAVSWSLQQLAKMWYTTQTERKPSKTQARLDIPKIPLIGEFPLHAASLKVKSSEICATVGSRDHASPSKPNIAPAAVWCARARIWKEGCAG